jgi:hypothetical protein
MKKWKVEVVRTSSRFLEIEVEADSGLAAKEKALEVAGDYEFPEEKDADYSCNYIVEL